MKEHYIGRNGEKVYRKDIAYLAHCLKIKERKPYNDCSNSIIVRMGEVYFREALNFAFALVINGEIIEESTDNEDK